MYVYCIIILLGIGYMHVACALLYMRVGFHLVLHGMQIRHSRGYFGCRGRYIQYTCSYIIIIGLHA